MDQVTEAKQHQLHEGGQQLACKGGKEVEVLRGCWLAVGGRSAWEGAGKGGGGGVRSKWSYIHPEESPQGSFFPTWGISSGAQFPPQPVSSCDSSARSPRLTKVDCLKNLSALLTSGHDDMPDRPAVNPAFTEAA